MNSKEKEKGMKVIPPGEQKCIWMDAGVVSYKLCPNEFQCNLCDYDRAMSNRIKKAKVDAHEDKPTTGNKKKIVEWMEEFRQFPADQRKCRYMLMGEVSYKICPNSFRCGECSFDQMMQDRIQPVFELDNPKLSLVAGFYLSEKLYYFRNHTWLRLERNGQYRLGIDDFAGKIICNPQGIVLPPIGKSLDLEEYAWTINHAYSDLDFVSPVKGVVTSNNQAIIDEPALIIQKPYSAGWMMTIEPENIMKSNRNFLNGEEVIAWIIEEAKLLKKQLSGDTNHDIVSITSDLINQLSKEKWNEIVKNHLYIR